MNTEADLTRLDPLSLRERAAHPLSTLPRAFLRWAGSKRALLPSLIDVLPDSYRTYYEPFLGSASLFFLLRPTSARLGDSCQELIDTYEAVRDDAPQVFEHARPLKPDRDLYYKIRGNRSSDRLARAAEFLYLNKTCWNGLYRVNSDGVFNVPYGAPKTDFIVDRTNLVACGKALRNPDIDLITGDFKAVVADAGPGDLVYLDPPYVTRHNNNGFVDYNEQLFSWSDQIAAATLASVLADRGAHVVVSNAHHDEVIALYEGFQVRPLDRASTIAANSAKRGRVREAIFWKGPPGICQ
jgi:DNA adenine methylase